MSFSPDALLQTEGLCGGYGQLRVLHDVSLKVPKHGLVTVVGRNGAGKSTLLRMLSGVQPGATGLIRFDGVDVTRSSSQSRVNGGLVHVPEGRQVFGDLSVQDNLLLGAYTRPEGRLDRLSEMFEMFPILGERRFHAAGNLSGGQQQMLALARALMGQPRLLMLDEPSMGLAPLVIEQIFKVIHRLKQSGTAILLVEQNARLALRIADYAYVLDSGRLVAEGTGTALANDSRIEAAYMGRQ